MVEDLDGPAVWQERFSGVDRIFGPEGSRNLRRAKVTVMGLGGVGSWAAEALARSGIGTLCLVDMDSSCLSNTNRQLHALEGNYGLAKTELMASRLKKVNPDLVLECRTQALDRENAASLIEDSHLVLDCIDSVADKAGLFLACRQRGIPLAISGAAGGKTDPACIEWGDLAQAQGDPLLRAMRKILRRDPAWVSMEPGGYSNPWARLWASNPGKRPPAAESWASVAVWSRENLPSLAPGGVGSRESPGAKATTVLGRRTNGAHGYGAVSFVTGAFGLTLASLAVRLLCTLDSTGPEPEPWSRADPLP